MILSGYNKTDESNKFIARERRDSNEKLGFMRTNATPHWKRAGSDKGTKRVEFTGNVNRGWVEIDTEEVAEGGKFAKRTMVLLDRDEAEILYKFLETVLYPT